MEQLLLARLQQLAALHLGRIRGRLRVRARARARAQP